MGEKSGTGSGTNKPDQVKILKFSEANPGSEMDKIRIRDKHPGSATLDFR
jgi:hypothetical protein